MNDATWPPPDPASTLDVSQAVDTSQDHRSHSAALEWAADEVLREARWQVEQCTRHRPGTQKSELHHYAAERLLELADAIRVRRPP